MSPETIKRCFRKAGILNDSFSVTHPYEHDPFLDIDANTSDIMEQIQPEGGTCTCAEFINGENDRDIQVLKLMMMAGTNSFL